MTGTGEGFHHNTPPKPVPEQPLEQEEHFSGPSPLGSLEALRKRQSETGAEDLVTRASRPSDPEESGGSVFDDDEDEPGSLLGELPDVIPNISDGGTDILKSGRAELREFHEKFLKQPAPDQSDSNERPTES